MGDERDTKDKLHQLLSATLKMKVAVDEILSSDIIIHEQSLLETSERMKAHDQELGEKIIKELYKIPINDFWYVGMTSSIRKVIREQQ